MKRYIDNIEIHDPELSYAIMHALEKNKEYSVECYDRDRCGHPLKNGNDVPCIELRIFRNEKIISSNIGFSPISTRGEEEDADNAEV